MHADGYVQSDIAAAVGVDQSTVSRELRRRPEAYAARPWPAPRQSAGCEASPYTSTRSWRSRWETTCTNSPSFTCSSRLAGQPGCARSAGIGSTGSSPSTRRASTSDSRPRSDTPRSSDRHRSRPRNRRGSGGCGGCGQGLARHHEPDPAAETSADESPKTARGSLMPTLLPKS